MWQYFDKCDVTVTLFSTMIRGPRRFIEYFVWQNQTKLGWDWGKEGKSQSTDTAVIVGWAGEAVEKYLELL
jgi:hypothetical protein